MSKLLRAQNTFLVKHNNLPICTTVTLPVSSPNDHYPLVIARLDSFIDPLALDTGFFLDLDRSCVAILP